MPITDITKNQDHRRGGPFVQTGNYVYDDVVIDFTKTPDLGGIFTHPIFDLKLGEAYCGLLIAVKEICASGGAATMQFRIGAAGDNLTGLIGVGNLGLGHFYRFGTLANTATDGVEDGFATAAAQTIQMDIATATFTAGRLYIQLEKIRDLNKVTQ